ncbi:hypothetical protein BV898_15618 [Hypsibius exemplaris]|uniref:SET domain-containing protein n=1 Tax=Hypsibius exemplaris TaxID=2072580 RepID=A0A9X6NE98_HYPEX|nr:hypothetical protein BV898_15618 [Hypsibius exemplaris]
MALELVGCKGTKNGHGRRLLEDFHRVLHGANSETSNAQDLRTKHRNLLAKLRSRASDKEKLVQSCPTATSKLTPASDALLSSLTEIVHAKLLSNIRAKGRFIILRTLEPVAALVGLETVAEDRAGDVCTLALYNYRSSKTETTPDEALPVGTVIILKEPVLKIDPERGNALRCDSPSDVVFVGRDSPFYGMVEHTVWHHEVNGSLPSLSSFRGSSAEEWKTEGNNLFKRGLFNEAREAYAVALQLLPADESKEQGSELRITIHLNLAQTYFRLGFFEETVLHTDIVLKQDPHNHKALFRGGRAHYELRRYQLALDHFDRLNTSSPGQPETMKELKKCRERTSEQTTGVNIYKLYLAAKLKPQIPIDAADFMSPMIKVVQRRGVVATEAIQPGTKILVCKALQADFTGPTFEDGSSNELVTELIQSVWKNPNTIGKSVYELTTNNAELDSHKQYCDEGLNGEPIADVVRIRKIVNANAFRLDRAPGHEPSEDGSALFVSASYFNHSCIPNAIYNDVVVFHVFKPVACGEEVTVAYEGESAEPFTARKKNYQARGFLCNCQLCQLDQAEPEGERKARDALIAAERELLDPYRKNGVMIAIPPAGILKSHRGVIQKLERSYSTLADRKSSLKSALFMPYVCQALTSGNRVKFVDYAEKAFESMGVSLKHLLECSDTGDVNIFGEGSLYSIHMDGVLAAAAMAGLDNSGGDRFLAALELLKRVTDGSNKQMVKAQFFDNKEN